MDWDKFVIVKRWWGEWKWKEIEVEDEWRILKRDNKGVKKQEMWFLRMACTHEEK